MFNVFTFSYVVLKINVGTYTKMVGLSE